MQEDIDSKIISITQQSKLFSFRVRDNSNNEEQNALLCVLVGFVNEAIFFKGILFRATWKISGTLDTPEAENMRLDT